MSRMPAVIFIIPALLLIASCGREETHTPPVAATEMSGEVAAVTETTVTAALEAAGVAHPFAEATLSTKLMGTITSVTVREGDVVPAGRVLATIDARDLAAKREQVGASQAEAAAMLREARTHAERMRTLYAEDAAPKAQLDAAETALARAEAGARAADAGAAELAAVHAYSQVRAPFSGVVVRRFVDVGAFAAPGAPLLTIQDPSRLRLSVTASPDAVRSLTRGQHIPAHVDGRMVDAVVEGVVPTAGNVYTVNAIIDNRSGLHMAGSTATLSLPQGTRTAWLVPPEAIHRQGDLTGLYIRAGGTTQLRWVRLGPVLEGGVEVLSGVRGGDSIVIPARVAGRN